MNAAEILEALADGPEPPSSEVESTGEPAELVEPSLSFGDADLGDRDDDASEP